ncbi:hypothetical protein [Sphingobium sp. EP60837]|uniref:hypothetical protein n=1 Tax=Sphingobium sp. EP60837 TaxID=1855519 RepID=UPI0007DD28E2|nr:hypothetical protein [Sphingobium sp. EP60837]ANI78996.1 hypothetical protein EP837_02601 [Sphingobium sp. EP60837]
MNLGPALAALWKRYWPHLLVGGAVVALILGLVIQSFRLSATQGALAAEKAARKADTAVFARAQSEAAQMALAAKLKKETEDVRKADAADARAADLAVRYRSLSLQYAQAQRAASVQHLSGATETASGGDGPDRSAVLPLGQLMIPEADAFICAGNQARLEAVREWALGLSASPPQ